MFLKLTEIQGLEGKEFTRPVWINVNEIVCVVEALDVSGNPKGRSIVITTNSRYEIDVAEAPELIMKWIGK